MIVACSLVLRRSRQSPVGDPRFGDGVDGGGGFEEDEDLAGRR
jgi:hypothetical protein